jgi:hypothetical protein
MNEYTDNGVRYEWESAGQLGSRYYLYPDKEHTIRDIAEAKKWLKINHDVVAIKIEEYGKI